MGPHFSFPRHSDGSFPSGVDSLRELFSLCSMSVKTLGEAWRLGWRVTARCAFGNRDGMKSIRQCIYRSELDMKTLVWTRGPNFPLSRLESRLMCPECGSRRVSLLFDVPKLPVAARVKRATERFSYRKISASVA